MRSHNLSDAFSLYSRIIKKGMKWIMAYFGEGLNFVEIIKLCVIVYRVDTEQSIKNGINISTT